MRLIKWQSGLQKENYYFFALKQRNERVEQILDNDNDLSVGKPERDRNIGIMIVVVVLLDDDEDYDSDHITTIIIIVTRKCSWIYMR